MTRCSPVRCLYIASLPRFDEKERNTKKPVSIENETGPIYDGVVNNGDVPLHLLLQHRSRQTSRCCFTIIAYELERFMSFCARRRITDEKPVGIDKITAKELSYIFYCPNKLCTCKFTARSLNSNKKSAHFGKIRTSEHIPGCWGDNEHIQGGRLSDYELKDFTMESFYLSLGKKARATEDITPKKRKKKEEESDGGEPKSKLYIHTIRQLYTICIKNPLDEEINGIRIKDIFAGERTAFIYKKYISGLKLVECSYLGYKTEKNLVFYKFPVGSERGKGFVLRVHVPDAYYKKIRHDSYYHTGKILIFANWNNSNCQLRTDRDIVFLKR